MVSIDFDNVKSEKAKALHHRFKSIGFFFRITEICLALLLLFWTLTSLLPFTVQISGVFLRRLASVVSTPLFMFLLGNSIVVALLATKSAVFSAAASNIDGGAEADIYDAFIRTGENRAASSADVVDLTEEIVVYDDKQIITSETDSNSNPAAAREDHAAVEPEENSVSVTDSPKDRPLRRSKSEISAKHCQATVTKPLLRRSETEKCRETVGSCGEEDPFPEDNLTNEEFQKTIEAFIAKQLVFRRRESLAVVIHNYK